MKYAINPTERLLHNLLFINQIASILKFVILTISEYSVAYLFSLFSKPECTLWTCISVLFIIVLKHTLYGCGSTWNLEEENIRRKKGLI